MNCRQCGKEMGNASFCPSCGAPANGAQQIHQQPVVVNVVNQNSNINTNTNINENINRRRSHYRYKSKWTAFWLCLLLGYFGVHRFYVEKHKSGILWLLTFGLFGIGWIADLVMILNGSFRDRAGYRLR